MKITKFVGLLVLIVALGAAVVLVRRTQETRRGATYADIEALFLPDSKSVKVGEEITSTFLLDTKTHKLTGVDVRIKFDPVKLEAKEVSPIIAGQVAGVALFRAESDVLSKSIDNERGLITLAGISMEEDVTKMATGAVRLVKVVLVAKASGSAQVTLDGSYDNMATGYNPASTDQSLAIKTVKGATYTITTTSVPTVTVKPTATNTPRPTAVSTVRPTVTVTPGLLGECGWCGSSCVRKTPQIRCVDVMPPVGKKCTEVAGECKVTSVAPTPTGGALSCNQRCTTNSKCGTGLTCVPMWWPTPCGEIPKTILEKVEMGTALSSVDISVAVRACPEVKNTLLPEADRSRVNESGTVTGGTLSVLPPAMIGVCRNSKCLTDTDCVCGGATPTKPPALSCRWCGEKCISSDLKVGCIDIAPPAGKKCTVVGGQCAVVTGDPAPTRTLTGAPKLTPVVTGTNRCSCPAGVPKKGQGNANCDVKVDLSDFENWRSEAFDMGGIEGKLRPDWKADFNCDQKVNLSDFEMWRVTYFK